MSGTITRIGATGAGALLALGLFAAAPPAGATGAGGHGGARPGAACFTATGHTQGGSHSDPDGMSNGGADKPGCTGGLDADRDGNNGCGNDADREDDNNGRCGGDKAKAARADHGRCERDEGGVPKPPATTTTAPPTTTTTALSGATGTPAADTSLGVAGLRLDAAGTVPAAGTPAAEPATTTAAAPTGADVSIVDAAAPVAAPDTQVLGESISRASALARTGAGVGGMALLGIVLCGSGRLAVLARRLLRIG